MSELRFEWDADKDADSRRKHRVSFEEAETVFFDPSAIINFDDSHSEREDRWRVLGLSERLRLLSVVYTKRNEETIRIISARRANSSETQRYADEA